jgi:hypothetical protein
MVSTSFVVLVATTLGSDRSTALVEAELCNVDKVGRDPDDLVL